MHPQAGGHSGNGSEKKETTAKHYGQDKQSEHLKTSEVILSPTKTCHTLSLWAVVRHRGYRDPVPANPQKPFPVVTYGVLTNLKPGE